MKFTEFLLEKKYDTNNTLKILKNLKYGLSKIYDYIEDFMGTNYKKYYHTSNINKTIFAGNLNDSYGVTLYKIQESLKKCIEYFTIKSYGKDLTDQEQKDLRLNLNNALKIMHDKLPDCIKYTLSHPKNVLGGEIDSKANAKFYKRIMKTITKDIIQIKNVLANC